MVVVVLYVGKTFETELAVGIAVQSDERPFVEVSTSYVSIDEPLFSMVKVRFIDSPGVRIM